MTSELEHSPPVLLDAIVLGWSVALVTFVWHSGSPPVRAWMAEAVEKGGVSALVLVVAETGHRQEAAHRELRLRFCREVAGYWVVPVICMRPFGAGAEKLGLRRLNGTRSENKSSCLASFPTSSLPAAGQTPPEDCVAKGGDTKA